MRVPVRRLPQTRVSEQQQGYARPAQPLDTSPLTQLMTGFREQLLDEQDDRQRVELNRRLTTEVNQLQEDFAARQRDPEISPIDFARNTDTAYTERHTALLNELRQNGFSRDLLDEFDGRLASVRQGFFERSLGHQMTQLASRAEEEIENTGLQASQYAAADPLHNYASARDTLRDSIRRHPDLTEEQRNALEDREMAVLRDGASRAFAIQHPQDVINAFDPQGLTAPYRAPAAATPGTAPTATPNATPGSWQSVATNVASELGLNPVEVASIMSYESGGTFSPTQMGGTGNRYMGLIQFGPEERRTYGITENSTPEQWTTAILSFMRDRGFRRGMSMLDFYSTINAGRPGQYDASDGNGTVRSHYERAIREHRGNAERWLGVARPEQTAQVQVIDLPPSSAPQMSDMTATVGEAPSEMTPDEQARASRDVSTDISSIVTGNPLLDDLNGVERMQLLGLAREQLTRQTATQRAEMDVRIGNITAEAIQNGGEIAAPIPTEQEVLNTYGPVEGPQRWAQIQQSRDTGRAIVGFRTQSATDIQAALDALEPQPGSPTYATQLQIYEGAQRAAQALLTEREQDPAAYAMRYFPEVRAAAQRSTAHYYAALDRVYETLGIDPDNAPMMTEEATRQITHQYDLMEPAQRREFFRQHMGEMGEERFRRFVHDMEGTTAESDARIFELLRTYPGRTGQVSSLFDQILEGRQAIVDDPARRPNPQQVLSVFREAGLDAITNLHTRASRAIQDAAEGLYVRRGGSPTDVDTGRNRTLYRQALAEVLGGNLPVDMRHGSTALRDFTILPPRVNEQQFRGWIERQTMESLTRSSVERRPPRYADLRTPVPAQDIIDEGVFVMVAPGQYMIKMSGDGRALATSSGRPFIVNIDPRAVVGNVARGGASISRSGVTR